jgi:hypothetical protein
MNIVDLYLDLMVSNVEDLKPGMKVRVEWYGSTKLATVVSIEDCCELKYCNSHTSCTTGHKFIMISFEEDYEESCCNTKLFNRRGIWLHTREEQARVTKRPSW